MDEILDKKGLTEAQALERYRKKNYPKPALTADIVIFSETSQDAKVLLIRRGNHPFCGKWALPGGFSSENETVEQTAARELEEETGISDVALKLVDVFSQPGRDPRGWTVSAAYCAVVTAPLFSHAGDDAEDARWFSISRSGSEICLKNENICLSSHDLAFDHSLILEKAMEKAGL